ncbi:uncharacterized protein PV09_02458 [Verruconis gallopava]|uniref:Uncharacterized protein n=1 Tax=Verruconis gallopava TaxID=253628 RepID=A0A0D2AJK7_9PEZI|nr:uncharacterized protein PV09_02458 [Verruconis gallopava]KIW06770.1 hypothetical protein PV09_02458 [Verruconis gallopava]
MTGMAFARVKYLDDAAQLVSSASPSTSAFLQARIDGLVSGRISSNAAQELSNDEKAHYTTLSIPKDRHLDVCASCGFPSLATSLRVESRRRSKSKQTRISSTAEKRVFVECPSCGAKAFHTLPNQPKKRKSGAEPTSADEASMRKALSSKPEQAEAELSKSSETPRTSNRKRTKSGKGNSLSAILARSKQQAAHSSQGFGLDLMDLMKSI